MTHSFIRQGGLVTSVLIFGLTSFGCAEDSVTGDDSVSNEVMRTESPLLQRGTKFPNGKVRVCWELAGNGIPTDASSQPNFDNLSRWTRESAENGWGSVAGINFTDWTNCPGIDAKKLSGWVAIHWEIATPANPTACQMGFEAGNKWTRLRLDPSVAEASFRKVALHEFGHCLGFDHEVNRDDRPANYGCNNSYPKIPGGTKLTDYDVASIMDLSYCSAADAGILTPWDIVGAQKVYGRKHSKALVGIGGRCVNIPNADPTLGTPLQLFDCTNVSNDKWTRSSMTNLNATLSGGTVRSINVPGGNPNTGALTIWSDVESSVNEHFDFKGVYLRGLGNLCLTSSNAVSGAVIAMQACIGIQDQKWDWEKVSAAPVTRNDRFRLSGTNLCINVPNATAVEGEALQVYTCGSPFYDNEMFSATSRGELVTLANPNARCLTVTPDKPTVGNLVVSSNCGGSTVKRNQQFSVSGNVKWAGDSGQCLDVANGVSVNGAFVQLHPCVAGAQNEVWQYYF